MEQITREELQTLAIRVEFTNLETGEKRFEVWKKVEANFDRTFQDSKGRYWRQYNGGWYNVTAFIVTPFMRCLKDIGRELGYNPDYVAPKKHSK